MYVCGPSVPPYLFQASDLKSMCLWHLSALTRTSFLQLRFTDKETKKWWQWMSLLKYVFRNANTEIIRVPSETMKRFIWKSLWSEVLMKVIVSVMTPYNYSNGQFFKLENHITVKIRFYEEEADTFPQTYKHVFNSNCLLNFFWVVVTNAFIGSKTTKKNHD